MQESVGYLLISTICYTTLVFILDKTSSFCEMNIFSKHEPCFKSRGVIRLSHMLRGLQPWDGPHCVHSYTGNTYHYLRFSAASKQGTITTDKHRTPFHMYSKRQIIWRLKVKLKPHPAALVAVQLKYRRKRNLNCLPGEKILIWQLGRGLKHLYWENVTGYSQ